MLKDPEPTSFLGWLRLYSSLALFIKVLRFSRFRHGVRARQSGKFTHQPDANSPAGLTDTRRTKPKQKARLLAGCKSGLVANLAVATYAICRPPCTRMQVGKTQSKSSRSVLYVCLYIRGILGSVKKNIVYFDFR